MRLVVIRAMEDAVDNLSKYIVDLAAPNQHLFMSIFNNMTSVKRVNSFEHVAVC